MSRKLGDTITIDFTIHNPYTGNVQDADSTPNCYVFENSATTPILTPTVYKRGNRTGNYVASIQTTSGNGFEVGKYYNVIASVTASSISVKSRISNFTLDSQRIGDTIGSINSAIASIQSDINSIDITIASLNITVASIYGIEGGRWRIYNNQMIVYKSDNSTEIMRFNLYNAAGNPAIVNVVDRQRV